MSDVTRKPPPPRGLGRGLDALLPVRPAPGDANAGMHVNYGEGNVFSCPLDKIVPNRGQPRQHFDADKLEELAQSIREHGLIEPLVVRRRPNSDQFELIAGERRWRAAQRANLREALVVVRDVSARDAYELALIENVQREDLDPIEFAEALDRLIREHGHTQETLATRLGKDRSTIANALRLLRLPGQIREKVVQGELSEGHARALLGAPDDQTLTELAGKVIRGRLSVRKTEELVRKAKSHENEDSSPAASGKPPQAPGKGSPPPGKSPSVRDLETRLERRLGTKIDVRDHEGKGEIVIKYADWDELDRILDIIL
ncbi:MAG TPA: ParB/RepB/Spo0J family partition protein [Polyangiaceae bacterium]|nr:ParB/RepB/Spo0J family partition protein [Polyangiaceae bacterium]